MKSETFFVFTGSESDKLKFVDPEPRKGYEYSLEQYSEIIEKNEPMAISQYFETITKQVEEKPKNPNEVLSPMQRVDILKLHHKTKIPIEEIEKYVAFGYKIDR